MDPNGEVEGAQVLVDSLKQQGVEYIFGVVGIPVVEIAVYAQLKGIHYVGMRNEQSAAYAAQAIGYLTGTPGACLCVSGPGVLHALGGLANAKANCWPMLLIGGASDTDQQGKGAFQEWDQVASCAPYCKLSARPSSISSIPYNVAQAVKTSVAGRQGPVYLDFPGDMLRATVPASSVAPEMRYPRAAAPSADEGAIFRALSVLMGAKKPLIVVGKGAAIARAEVAVRELVSVTGAPFLPTPMGKGVVSDTHPQCVAACRSTALSQADTILLLGARTNWMLHFAAPPRFRKNVNIIQVDLHAEEQSTSVPSAVTLLGDIGSVCRQLTTQIRSWGVSLVNMNWWEELAKAMDQNDASVKSAVSSESTSPLGYYSVFDTIAKVLPKDCIVATEGANTMDIGRSFLNHQDPRLRLDAGSFGTMGVGLSFAIAAAVNVQTKGLKRRVVCIEGDSAFGFSGMEVETMYRYKLPIVIIIVNNNGIYGGVTKDVLDDMNTSGAATLTTPPTTLFPDADYHKMADMFRGKGYHCTTLQEIKDAINSAMDVEDQPTIINIAISPFAQRKSQKFDWLTRTEAKL